MAATSPSTPTVASVQQEVDAVPYMMSIMFSVEQNFRQPEHLLTVPDTTTSNRLQRQRIPLIDASIRQASQRHRNKAVGVFFTLLPYALGSASTPSLATAPCNAHHSRTLDAPSWQQQRRVRPSGRPHTRPWAGRTGATGRRAAPR